MSEAFDPYYKWLAIPPDHQPPDHYRLLGVQVLESDPDVIESAAYRQMAHLRSYAIGTHGELCQRLLNEVSTAKLALLDPEKKSAYDAMLVARQPATPLPPPSSQSSSVPSSFAQPLPPIQPHAPLQSPRATLLTRPSVPSPVEPLPNPASAPSNVSEQMHDRISSGSGLQLLVSMVAVVAVVLAILVAVRTKRGDRDNVAQEAQRQNPPVVVEPSGDEILPENSDQPATPDVPKKVDPLEPTTPAVAPISSEKPVPLAEDRPELAEQPEQAVAKPQPILEVAEPREGPSSFHALPNAKAIDMLKLLTPFYTGHVKSLWDDDELVLLSGGNILIPHDLPDEYILKMVIEQHGPTRLKNIYIEPMVGRHRAFLGMDGTRDEKAFSWGLHFEGTHYLSNESTRKGPFFFKNKANTVVVIVRKNAIRALCNGHTVIDWTGDPQRLGPVKKPTARDLKIVSYFNPCRIRELTLYEPSAMVETIRFAEGPPLDPPAPRPPANRLVVPSEEQQEESLRKVRELFEENYKKDKSREKKFAFAQQMYDAARQTNDDSVGRFVLLVEARDLAVATGNVEAAMQAVDVLNQHYEIDQVSMRLEVLRAANRTFRILQTQLAIVFHARRASGFAIAEDRFDEANVLAALALSSARRTKDSGLIKQTADDTKRLAKLESVYRKSQSAFEILEIDPQDPEANLIAGKYLCFHKSDWPGGLPMLAISNDPDYQSAAQLELAIPDTDEEIETLGDTWWNLAAKTDDGNANAIRARAAIWYRRVQPDLQGLKKVKVDKRLEEVSKQTP